MKKIKIEVIITTPLDGPEIVGAQLEVNRKIKECFKGEFEKSSVDQVVSVYGVPISNPDIHRIPFWARRIINRLYKSNL